MPEQPGLLQYETAAGLRRKRPKGSDETALALAKESRGGIVKVGL